MTTFSYSVVALIVIAIFTPFGCIGDDPPVNVDDLDPLKECKRWIVQAVESNNKVYLYGGSSWISNGTEEPYRAANHYLRIVDFTLARDMSDPSILTVKDIPGNITIFSDGLYWGDAGKLYVVGGKIVVDPWIASDGSFPPTNVSYFKGSTIFSYDIEADRWSADSAVQPDSGSSVTDSFCCGAPSWNAKLGRAYFYSGGTMAGSIKDEAYGSSNMLTFDTGKFKWSNETTDYNLTTTWTDNAQMTFLPGTETSSGGIAVILGGIRKDRDEAMESLRRVLVYDSSTSSWYGQETTAEGDNFPPNRMGFCAVAASAPDNSSHNIYIYGGTAQEAQPDAFNDMHILSVPSFHWTSVNVSSPPRSYLACTKVAERYMMTYGGLAGGWQKDGSDDDCDQENYGLRLFDLSALNWTSRYEGPASESNSYTVPSVVYDAIGGGASGGATQTAPSAGFNTPGLQSLFQRSSSGPTNLSSPTSTSKTGSNKSSNVGAIAGGVVGVLVVVTLMIIGALFLKKKRKGAEKAPKPDMPATSSLHEADSTPSHPRELPGSGQERTRNVYEIDGSRFSPR